MENHSFGRLAGALVAPVKTFRAIAERPTWLLAWLLLYAVVSGISFLSFQKVDFAAGVREQFAEQHVQLPAGSEERAAKIGKYSASIAVLLAFPFLIFLTAAIYLAFNLIGGELNYKRSLAVVAHAALPRGLAALLSLPILLSRSELTLKEVQQGGVLRANLSFLAPEGAAPALLALLTNLDLFSFWSLALSMVGFHYAAMVSKGAAVTGVLLFWLAGIGLQMGALFLTTHMRGGS
ncbi:MAG TPA: YIP1 family protein [Thermoanaerobaculia bacterium]|nr:YIP1 family protein [Thermoanaerobaculia bacterium]